MFKKIMCSAVVCAFLIGIGTYAESGEVFEGAVTVIDNDRTPESTPGPGSITQGVVAFDYGYRSLFVQLKKAESINRIVLKCSPGTNATKRTNQKLATTSLHLYYSNDNAQFLPLKFVSKVPDAQTIVMEGFMVKARYWKVHMQCPKGDYTFVNELSKLSPTFIRVALKGKPYYDLKDPLFTPLLGDKPAAQRALYWSANCHEGRGNGPRWYPTYAKMFGHRYVLEEQLEETAKHNLIDLYSNVKRTPKLREHGIDIWRFITGGSGEAIVPSIDGMPMVFGTQGWLMDSRWFNEYLRRAIKKARSGEQWALCAGDELWEVQAIRVVPKAKRYDQVVAADKEIRMKYGFGKYGMPDSNDDTNPFTRIAHRRWVSDRLTELFKKTYLAVKKVRPETVMMAPDFASGVPAADVEAWAPFFDIFEGQSNNGPSPFIANFCVGCDTKVLVDLTGKPVWMAVQNADLFPGGGEGRTPEFIREMYSQVFRNGGQGIVLLAEEWFQRELRHPKYSSPAKWRALLQVIDIVTKMKLPRLPEADCAILYSSDSLLTLRFAQMNNGNWELYSAYTALGPLLRSWFHFVSDRQIVRGQCELEDYRVLYIPFAEYGRPALLNQIEAYVKGGGTVVLTDPEAFTWNIDGTRFASRWTKLTGVERKQKRDRVMAISTCDSSNLSLKEELSFTSLLPGWKISCVSDKVEIVGKFKDGSPAITLHPYGKGKVIYFAADPFAVPGGWTALESLVAPNSPVVKLVGAIQSASGVKMGHDIWRFKLPPYTGDDLYQKDKGICLTNNYVYDSNKPLLEPNNVACMGTYTYGRYPTGYTDTVGADAAAPIPFAKGHLTNRLAAYQSLRKGYHQIKRGGLAAVPAKWIVSWKDKAPVSILFDLKKEYPLKKIRLFYSATLPSLTVSGSVNGKVWQELASSSEDSAGRDVKDITLSLRGMHRYVRLDFSARRGGKKFELAEVEIWGDEVK